MGFASSIVRKFPLVDWLLVRQSKFHAPRHAEVEPIKSSRSQAVVRFPVRRSITCIPQLTSLCSALLFCPLPTHSRGREGVERTWRGLRKGWRRTRSLSLSLPRSFLNNRRQEWSGMRRCLHCFEAQRVECGVTVIPPMLKDDGGDLILPETTRRGNFKAEPFEFSRGTRVLRGSAGGMRLKNDGGET